MPRLLGHFPLTITLCLRALALHYTATYYPAASGRLVGGGRAGGGGVADPVRVRDALVVLFQRPFYAAKNPALLQQMQHLFRCAGGRWLGVVAGGAGGPGGRRGGQQPRRSGHNPSRCTAHPSSHFLQPVDSGSDACPTACLPA